MSLILSHMMAHSQHLPLFQYAMCLGRHVVCVLQLILDFYSLHLKKVLEKFSFVSETHITTHKHIVDVCQSCVSCMS